ncbi:ISNCY family transposase, partial [Acinetobacter baumannii]|nr:ISNCY family transposase [Acinetobacter baumannii]
MREKLQKRVSPLEISICLNFPAQSYKSSQAAQLLHISERQIRRLLQKYKAQG